eukprot:RCo020208
MSTPFFQKTLADVVKGIRGHKRNEKEYIQKCIGEVREELRSTDSKVKCTAVQKCTYFQMLGYDIEWAAFHIVEVMVDSNFQAKRVGYLAASLCFTPTTDVIALTTNLLKKDLQSSNQFEAGLALSCIASICTPDLAKDLVADVVSLLSSSRSYIRKKVVLVLFKVFLQFPEALRPSFPRLKEKLEDPDPSVVASTVNTICELARKNPQNYLGLAPVFFNLLTSVKTNWTLIKIVKLFGALTPSEPRLAKKIVAPLTVLIDTTPAKSLLYECLNTASMGMDSQPEMLKLSADKLKLFVEDRDQNLKYLGLLGLHNIMKKNPKLVADMRDTVLQCLGDEDITIRYRALELVVGMVNQRNLQAIVAKLFEQIPKHEGDYKNDLIQKVVEMCTQNDYALVSSFEWFLRLLMDLVQCELKNVRHGRVLAEQFLSVISRVPDVRSFGIRCMSSILCSNGILMESLDSDRSNLFEVLEAAAWLCGEYTEFISDPAALLGALLQPSVCGLPGHTQGVIVQAALKIFVACASGNAQSSDEKDDRETSRKGAKKLTPEVIEELHTLVSTGIKNFLSSTDIEVQERAAQTMVLLELYRGELPGLNIASAFRDVISEELRPVGPNAQKKVPVPPSLDLESPLMVDVISSEDESSAGSFRSRSGSEGRHGLFSGETPGDAYPAGDSSPWGDATRSSYILTDEAFPRRSRRHGGAPEDEVEPELPPVKRLQRSDFDDLGMRNFRGEGSRKSGDRRTKTHGRRGREDADREDGKPPERAKIAQVVDLPEGAVASEEEARAESSSRHHKSRRSQATKSKPEPVVASQLDPNSVEARLNVDLSAPLRPDESLPQVQAYKREDPNDYFEASRLRDPSEKGKSDVRERRHKHHRDGADEEHKRRHHHSRHHRGEESREKPKDESRSCGERRDSASANDREKESRGSRTGSNTQDKSEKGRKRDRYASLGAPEKGRRRESGSEKASRTSSSHDKGDILPLSDPGRSPANSHSGEASAGRRDKSGNRRTESSKETSAKPSRTEMPPPSDSSRRREHHHHKGKDQSDQKPESSRGSRGDSRGNGDSQAASSRKGSSVGQKSTDKAASSSTSTQAKKPSSIVKGRPSSTASFCTDSTDLLLWYEPDTTAASGPTALNLDLQLRNQSSEDLELLGCELKGTMNLKARFLEAPTFPCTLSPGGSLSWTLSLSFKDMVRAQSIDGTVRFTKAGADSSLSLALLIPVPCSLFMSEVEMTRAQVEELMEFQPMCAPRVRQVQIPADMDVRRALQATAKLLRLKLVCVIDSVAT